MAKKNKNAQVHGIIPFAKKPGPTSFSSLWSIKHALETEKVGHTGTLDSFAEGLLVVLSGNLTHLVPHVTAFTKTYQAVVCFGRGTDTLDPTIAVSSEGPVPTKSDIESIISEFTGALLQVPPVYSAVHVDGKRASDMVRSGEGVALEPRQVFVYENKLLDFKDDSEHGASYALLEIKCSKGTYIRAIARDMAERLGTVSHLCALRRTQVGPFTLEDAACAESLGEFTIEHGLENEKYFARRRLVEAPEKIKDSPEVFSSVRSHLLRFTPELASLCGFSSAHLVKEFERVYSNGRPLMWKMFRRIQTEETGCENGTPCEWQNPDEIAVFYEDGQFAGMLKKLDGKPKYGFVVPHAQKKLTVFSWQNVLDGEFSAQWQKRGTALSVGSFDGMHLGHMALLDRVLSETREKNLVSGVVTFSLSCRNHDSGYKGSVLSLSQKLAIIQEKGFDFALVIDFSDEFSKISGTDFMRCLKQYLGMAFLAEGTDFRCGYKGALSMKELPSVAEELGFSLASVDDVLMEGKRVSSSRIREAVLSCDFIAVQKMLQRPFSYDCTGLEWNVKSEDKNGIWFSAKRKSDQVLPKDGTYNVVAILSGDGASKDSVELKNGPCNTLHTTFVAGEKEISLFAPTKGMVERVQALNFFKE